MEERRIHVITASHNRREITLAFAQSLKAQTHQNIHLILVDDGCTDGTAEAVLNCLPNTTVLQGNGNLWWGGSLHLAYKYLRDHLGDSLEDGVLISNDDVILPQAYIKTAMALLQEHPGTLISGCGYDAATGKLVDGAYKRDFTHREPEAVEYVPAFEDGDVCSSRSLFTTVGDFLKIGGFHPVLLPHYASDYAWTAKATKKGYKIKMCPELSYQFDYSATGDNFYDSLTAKKAFSRRSAANPFYKFTYILLSTPKEYLLSELWWQIKRYGTKWRTIWEVLKRK